MSKPLFGLFLQFEVNERSKVMFNLIKTLLTLGSTVRFAIILNWIVEMHVILPYNGRGHVASILY